MKKLLAIILLIAVLLPAAALADPDPIVGSWYLCYDKLEAPEMAYTFEGYDKVIVIYNYTEEGYISVLEGDINGMSCSPVFYTAGKWEKTDTGYKCSIIGSGEINLILEGDYLFSQIPDSVGYMTMRRIIPLNPYKDVVRK